MASATEERSKDAAASFNIAQSTYCEWEASVRLPKTKYIVPLAHALCVKTEVILQCIHGENPAQDEEIQRLREENKHLRQRETELQQLVELLAKKDSVKVVVKIVAQKTKTYWVVGRYEVNKNVQSALKPSS